MTWIEIHTITSFGASRGARIHCMRVHTIGMNYYKNIDSTEKLWEQNLFIFTILQIQLLLPKFQLDLLIILLARSKNPI